MKRLRNAKMMLALLAVPLIVVRLFSPLLHTEHPDFTGSHVVAASVCPSCDLDATQATEACAAIVLPSATLVGFHVTPEPVSHVRTGRISTPRLRGPPQS